MLKTRQDYQKQHDEDVQTIFRHENLIRKHVHHIKTLELEIERLKGLNTVLESELNILKNEADYIKNLKAEYQSVLHDIYWAPSFNERGTGRIPKLTPNVIAYIKKHRSEGRTQREIAKMLGLSIGLVNKACNMPSEPQA